MSPDEDPTAQFTGNPAPEERSARLYHSWMEGMPGERNSPNYYAEFFKAIAQQIQEAVEARDLEWAEEFRKWPGGPSFTVPQDPKFAYYLPHEINAHHKTELDAATYARDEHIQRKDEWVREATELRTQCDELASTLDWIGQRMMCHQDTIANEPCVLNDQPDTWCIYHRFPKEFAAAKQYVNTDRYKEDHG